MNEHFSPEPIEKKIFTPGVIIMLILMANGLIFGLKRFLFGLGSTTNLSNFYPWGIWISIDVASGVALSAGGFTSAALIEIFHRDRYHPLLRPALLTAMLGYTFVGLGVFIDLGRYYNIWHPMLPSMWSGHSALFEVGMCVMTYLTVLYIEFIPVVVDKFKKGIEFPQILSKLKPFIEKIVLFLDKTIMKVMFVFTILGVVLSCMHQSSLGALMVLAKTKMNALWWSPILPLLFLLSAFSVGFPMVIVESFIASKSFNRKLELNILAPLSKIIVVLLGFYAIAKISDLTIRNQLGHLFDGSIASSLCLMEIVFGIFIPFFMLLNKKVRWSPPLLFTASLLIVLGVLMNRINVFLVAFNPPYASKIYFPSFGEISVTLGMIAALMFLYRIFVSFFPIIPGSITKGEITNV